MNTEKEDMKKSVGKSIKIRVTLKPLTLKEAKGFRMALKTSIRYVIDLAKTLRGIRITYVCEKKTK